MSIHPRNEKYLRKILDASYEISIERARYFTESYRSTEGEHPALRAAKALSHTLSNMKVSILDEEQIVGNRSDKVLGTVIPVERGDINTVLEMELDMLLTREQQPYRMDTEDKKVLQKEILPYWRGKTLRDRKKELWKANGLHFRPAFTPLSLYRRAKSLDIKKLRETSSMPKVGLRYGIKGIKELEYNNPAFVMNVFDVQGHLIIGQRNVLAEGFMGIKEKAENRLRQAVDENDDEGRAFCESIILCCDAIRDFAGRYADEAEVLAKQERNPERKKELLDIATRCRHVPYNPPRDFPEAVQALWLAQVGGLIAYGMAGILAIGRVDQYLYSYFEKDKREGHITDEQATALIEELLLKLSHNVLMIPFLGKNTGSELGADSCAPTIGGVGPDGEDAVNELSYLWLKAFANVRGTGNSFMVRLSEKSPPDFWKEVMKTYRKTSGAALFSDEVYIEALVGCGYKIEDARNYGLIGCVEPTGDSDTFGCTSGNDISLVAALEMALLNGHLRIMGKRIGPRSGDPRKFTNFDQFLEAFNKQVAFMVRTIAKAVNLKDRAYLEGYPCPYVSATLTGCIENARDMTQGGAKYNFGSIGARGFGTVVDSLLAIKEFVFEKNEISMGKLVRMLDNNFRSFEKLRQKFASKSPKYGSDEDRADLIAKELAEFFCKEVSNQKNIRGGPFRPGFFSYGMHVMEGWMLGATPNGRLAGEPISNSFSPANGSEREGPTAMLRSVAKIDHSLISNGCAINIKLLPSMFETDEGLEKMTALIKGYFKLGGMEIQPNVVSNRILLDAQKHPENYRDLAVRVSGYSAYFTDLGKPLQDEIISRTEFCKL